MNAKGLALPLMLASAAVVATVVAACGPKAPATNAGASATATQTAAEPSESATATATTASPTDAATIPVPLWTAESPLDRLAEGYAVKEGELRRVKVPEEDETGHVWPYSVEMWGITRTDLKTLLDPYVGRRVRVRGVYRKIYINGVWRYEVVPDRILLLPPSAATPTPPPPEETPLPAFNPDATPAPSPSPTPSLHPH